MAHEDDAERAVRAGLELAEVIGGLAMPADGSLAARAGIAKAAETIHGIRGAWISEEYVVVENDEITEFRVTMRVSFVLD